jgi:hypothetical protein
VKPKRHGRHKNVYKRKWLRNTGQIRKASTSSFDGRTSSEGKDRYETIGTSERLFPPLVHPPRMKAHAYMIILPEVRGPPSLR